jgi:FkbM family methyltransferase
MYSVMFSLAWPDAKIFAIEPVQQNIDVLRKNTEPFPNIEIVHAAASDKSGTVTMQMPTQEQLYKHRNVEQRTDYDIMSVHGESGRHKQEVRAITLDELVGDDPVDFMKIDAEGHDFLRNQRPSIMVEVVDYTLEMAGHDSQDINKFMAYYQYARMFRLHINEIFVPV